MGYDIIRFKNSEINPEFICGICHDVLQNPLVIDPCDHTFCSDCINLWINEQEKCPVDRDRISKHNLHKPFRLFMNLLNDLEINCDFLDKGCKAYMKLGELVLHTHKCTFNPNLRVVCECGLSIVTNELMHHHNDCVDYLKIQLSGALDLVNSMKSKMNEIESDLKESRKDTTVLSEWDRVLAIRCIETSMSKITTKLLLEIINDSLNERKFDIRNLKERFREEFGGNWDIYYGIGLNGTLSDNYFLIEIGKISILISMSIKPANDALIVNKFMEVLELELEKKVWSENWMKIGGHLHNLTCDSFNLSERLLDKNIMGYFIQYDTIFPYNDIEKYNSMIGAFANISEFQELRKRLMEKEFITIILRLISHPNHLNAYLSYKILANILSENKQFWEQHFKHDRLLNRNIILAQMKTEISKWKLNSTNCLNFITFKPFHRLLRCNIGIPQEVHYFAVWTLASYSKMDCERYCHLLREDGCIPVLQELVKSKKTEDYVKNLANLVLLQSQQFSKMRQLR